MIIKPDIFLLIIISVGVCVIIVGMITVINCPVNTFSCCPCCLRKWNGRRTCPCRRKKKWEKSWSKNIINYDGPRGYPVSLVGGHPQHNGYDSKDTWESSETTTTATLTGRHFLGKNNDNPSVLENYENRKESRSSGLDSQEVCSNCNGKGLIRFIGHDDLLSGPQCKSGTIFGGGDGNIFVA